MQEGSSAAINKQKQHDLQQKICRSQNKENDKGDELAHIPTQEN